MTNQKTINLITKHIKLLVMVAFTIITFLGVAFCYYFLPILLNYGPGTINTNFDKTFSGGITYLNQFTLIFFAVFVVGNILLAIEMKDFDNIPKYLSDKDSKLSIKKLEKIKEKCISIPQRFFSLLTFLPPAGVAVIFFFLNFTSAADFKVFLVVSITVLLVASLGNLMLKTLLKSVLNAIGNTDTIKKYRKSLSMSLLMQFLPLIIISILYTYLITYSINMEDKSSILKSHYTYAVKNIISSSAPITIEELESNLNRVDFINSKDSIYLIDDNNNFINFNNSEVSDFFIKYTLEIAEEYNNVIYDYYGTESQGVLIPITFNGRDFKVVVKYDLTSHGSSKVFLNIAIVLTIGIISSLSFSHSIVKDISTVASNMTKISKNNANALQTKLTVTSSDEIGDLVAAFNKIQELTNDNIKEIENSQRALMEKERLASLGQLIGGIAHNMKTPIMSISGAAEGLTELVSEYMASIDNPIVTAEDHKDIAKDMLDWITKIKTHTAYMSDILTAVKGQASQLIASEDETFTVYDLFKRVDILIKHEIKKALLTLDIDIKCDPSQIIHGDINNLIQVVNNLITNAIQSYDGKPNEHINLSVDVKENNVIIKVKDTGCGISQETKNKLFKEMVTTKGKNGTGLGLYMSYSTIKGKFNGDLSFESEEGVGTTFTIAIPIS